MLKVKEFVIENEIIKGFPKYATMLQYIIRSAGFVCWDLTYFNLQHYSRNIHTCNI